MATDLKIEIFAFKLFHTIWYNVSEIKDVPDIFEIYGDECNVDDTYLEVWDDCYLKAVYCRSSLFYSLFETKLSLQEVENIKSLSEAYEYIVYTCNKDDLFGHLTVFERMLATAEFVANTFTLICRNIGSFVNVLRYGHMLWAMYFDKFTDEFYKKGGWSKLKLEANSYSFLFEFTEIFYKGLHSHIRSVKEASVNYCRFKNAIDYQKLKSKYSVPISKLWVKFRIENFESYINIPLRSETSISANQAEQFLKNLKQLLDPLRCNRDDIKISTNKHQNSIFSTEMTYSKIQCDKQRMDFIHSDNSPTQDSVSGNENTSIDKTLCGFSHISPDYEGGSKSKCPTSFTEKLTFDSDRNLEMDEYNSMEMDLPRQTKSLGLTKSSVAKQNFLTADDMVGRPKAIIKDFPNASGLDSDCIHRSKSDNNRNEDNHFESFSESSTAVQIEITNTDKFLPFPQTEKTGCHRNSVPNVVGNFYVSGNSNEGIDNVNKTKNLNQRKITHPSATVETVAASPNNKTVAYNRDLISLEPHIKKDLGSVKDNADCVESRRVGNALEDLRNEQRNPQIKNFLKMLLVLDDLEDRKLLLSTFENCEEGPFGRQKCSNRKKKNLKAKKNRTNAFDVKK